MELCSNGYGLHEPVVRRLRSCQQQGRKLGLGRDLHRTVSACVTVLLEIFASAQAVRWMRRWSSCTPYG